MKTTQEMIKIMNDSMQPDVVVECTPYGSDRWGVSTQPLWNWVHFDYRVRKKQVEVPIESDDVRPGTVFCLKTSIDLSCWYAPVARTKDGVLLMTDSTPQFYTWQRLMNEGWMMSKYSGDRWFPCSKIKI